VEATWSPSSILRFDTRKVSIPICEKPLPGCVASCASRNKASQRMATDRQEAFFRSMRGRRC